MNIVEEYAIKGDLQSDFLSCGDQYTEAFIALKVIKPLLDVLVYLNEANVVHRDNKLSLGNFLTAVDLNLSPATGRIDFIDYMAPEMFSVKDMADPAASMVVKTSKLEADTLASGSKSKSLKGKTMKLIASMRMAKATKGTSDNNGDSGNTVNTNNSNNINNTDNTNNTNNTDDTGNTDNTNNTDNMGDSVNTDNTNNAGKNGNSGNTANTRSAYTHIATPLASSLRKGEAPRPSSSVSFKQHWDSTDSATTTANAEDPPSRPDGLASRPLSSVSFKQHRDSADSATTTANPEDPPSRPDGHASRPLSSVSFKEPRDSAYTVTTTANPGDPPPRPDAQAPRPLSSVSFKEPRDSADSATTTANPGDPPPRPDSQASPVPTSTLYQDRVPEQGSRPLRSISFKQPRDSAYTATTTVNPGDPPPRPDSQVSPVPTSTLNQDGEPEQGSQPLRSISFKQPRDSAYTATTTANPGDPPLRPEGQASPVLTSALYQATAPQKSSQPVSESTEPPTVLSAADGGATANAPGSARGKSLWNRAAAAAAPETLHPAPARNNDQWGRVLFAQKSTKEGKDVTMIVPTNQWEWNDSYDEKVDVWQELAAALIMWADVVHWADTISPEAIEFIQACLTKDPQERPSAQDLLKHKWIVEHLAGRDCLSQRELRESLAPKVNVDGTPPEGLLRQATSGLLGFFGFGKTKTSSMVHDLEKKNEAVQLDTEKKGRAPTKRLDIKKAASLAVPPC
eukprot:gene2231-33713_t